MSNNEKVSLLADLRVAFSDFKLVLDDYGIDFDECKEDLEECEVITGDEELYRVFNLMTELDVIISEY